jgi:dienelactone hydrolase
MKNRITIKGQDGAFEAYIAQPAALPAPAVVVLQELFGVNADIRKTRDELAEKGFMQLHLTCSGDRSPVLTSASPQRPAGSMACDCTRLMIETPASKTSKTPSQLRQSYQTALARLLSLAIASAR